MSVTFYSNAQATVTPVQEPCLCAQGAERWSMDADFADPVVLADLRANASATCPWCHGSGVELAERISRFAAFVEAAAARGATEIRWC